MRQHLTATRHCALRASTAELAEPAGYIWLDSQADDWDWCSESLQKQDFTGLKDLQSENPNALGIILYGGQTVLQVASQIIAVPFSIFL